MLADHALGPAPALTGERDDPPFQLEIALVAQAADHLGHGRGRMSEPLDQAGLDDLAALFLQLVDGFQVLLERRMHALRHAVECTDAAVAEQLRYLGRSVLYIWRFRAKETRDIS